MDVCARHPHELRYQSQEPAQEGSFMPLLGRSTRTQISSRWNRRHRGTRPPHAEPGRADLVIFFETRDRLRNQSGSDRSDRAMGSMHLNSECAAMQTFPLNEFPTPVMTTGAAGSRECRSRIMHSLEATASTAPEWTRLRSVPTSGMGCRPP